MAEGRVSDKEVIQVSTATAEVLDRYREALTIARAKALVRSSRSAYSMANCFCGASGDQLAAIRNLFKSVWGVDRDQDFRKLYCDLNGLVCHSDVTQVNFEQQISPILFVYTPPCP